MLRISFILLFLIAFPLFVQAQVLEDAQERRALAQEMHEIWPIRPRIENVLDEFSETLTFEERPTFKAAMRRAIKFDRLEKESIEAMAKIFTKQELEAMVAFYGSPIGRSVNAKTEDYQTLIEPVITEMLDQALMDIRTGNAPGSIGNTR